MNIMKAKPKQQFSQMLQFGGTAQVWTLVAALTLSGCAKIREAAFAPGEDEDLFTISELTGARLELEEQEGDAALLSQALRESARSQADALPEQIRLLQAPDRLKSVFESLQVHHGDRPRFEVVLTIDSGNLTAWRVVESAERLSELDRALLQKQDSQNRLPLFQVPVKAFGQIEKVRNELGEETTRLQLKNSNWADATHVRIGIHGSDRTPIAVVHEAATELFARSRLEGRVTRASQLSQDLGVVLAFSDEGALVQTRVNGSDLQVWEVTTRRELAPELSKRLARTGGQSEQVAACTGAVSERALKEGRTAEDCVMVLRYTVPMMPVRARIAQDDAGRWKGTVELTSETSRDATTFRIAHGSIASHQVLDPEAFSRAAANVVRVSEFEKGSFHLRTVLVDVPNLFPDVFAGASSELERVRFIFEDKRVDVVREKALLERDRTSRADLETLMSYPVTYWKAVDRDAQGAKLAQPRYERARRTDSQALAEIDFSGNGVPRLDSPLQYMGVEDCLGAPAFTSVSDVDSNETRGALAFTLEKTFIDSLGSRGCYAGGALAGLTGQYQTHFTFQERVSLQRAPEATDSYLVNLEERLQRTLGFGFFTSRKVVANSAGNFGRTGTRVEGPSVLDLAGGKRITYILAGIPSREGNASLRIKLIAATRQVVRDWNDAFTKALEGTPRAAQGAVLDLLIEGEDDARIAELGLAGGAGDLHRNEIRWFDRASETGVIGIGGPHSDPRTGALVSGAVYIYGGNIRSAVESMQLMAQGELARESAIAQAVSNPVSQAGRPDSALKPKSDTALSVQDRLFVDALKSSLKGPVKSVRTLGQKFREALISASAGSARDLQALRAESRALERRAKAQQALQQRQQCALDAGAEVASLSQGARHILRSSSEDLAVAMFRSTLAHELGHNLGLRHNFISSYDVSNWKFNEQDPSKRTYSSIMDYLVDDHASYDGMGPHDVAALRLAYTGRVETQEGILAVSELRQRAESGSAPVIKKYLFCTDENVGDDPRCRRHDAGTSPRAIVEFLRSQVLNSYQLTHLGSGRLVFNSSSLPGFFSSRMQTYLELRQFIDEWNRVRATSQDEVAVSEWRDAARVADEFLHEVVRTPDIMAPGNPLNQIAVVRDADGKNLLFEPRIFDDVSVEDADGERLLARGWKHDKVAALLSLMLRDYGHPRYQKSGLSISPIEFELESGLFEVNGKADSPTLALARDILEDRFVPEFIKNPELPMRRTLTPMSPGMASAGSSGMLLYPIVIGGVMGLDAAGSEITGNGLVDLARTFRVGAGYRAPPGLVSVSESGSLQPVAGERRHFALAGSEIGAGLVRATHGRDEMVAYLSRSGEQNPALQLREIVMLAKIGKNARTAEQTARLMELMGRLKSGLEQVSDDVGTHDVGLLVPMTLQILDGVSKLSPSTPEGAQLSDEERMNGFRAQFMEFVDAVDSNPGIALVWNSLDFKGLGFDEMYQIDAREILASRRMQIFRRLEILSDVLYQSHPELF